MEIREKANLSFLGLFQGLLGVLTSKLTLDESPVEFYDCGGVSTP